MKRVVLFVLVVTGSFVTLAQTPDSIANKLLVIDESMYVGKPLDSLISVLPSGIVSMRIYGVRTTARLVSVQYPNRVFIHLHVREFTHMISDDPNRQWNLALMRKEKLHSIAVYYGTKCYKGCPQY